MSSGSTYDDAAAGNYQDLPQGNFIRCLVLSPGSGSDPLACELQTVDLDKQPDFEAISYVWGSDVKSETISCNGRTTYITANLSAALKRVRYASEPRSLWADSICIDQKNDKEKSHQVALMGKIYSCSRRTLIHIIGNDNGHAASVQSLVSLLDKSINHELNKIDPENDYVSLLLAQPWFHRGWVIQEAVLAKDAV
ncbi:HET-domain-containing protein, partial [Cryphonectria parasitica EP155]